MVTLKVPHPKMVTTEFHHNNTITTYPKMVNDSKWASWMAVDGQGNYSKWQAKWQWMGKVNDSKYAS